MSSPARSARATGGRRAVGARPGMGRAVRRRGPAGVLPLAALLACAPLLVTGCADTTTPVLGGLRVGVSGGSFHVPVLRNERLPFRYPAEAWRNRVGGETRLRIHITREGTVDSAYVVKSSGHPSLDSAALTGARELRYRPARRGDRPVAVWAVLPVRYPMPEEVDPDTLAASEKP